ncbi:hypothetical protein OCL06_09240 [Alteromonas sp. ASW11-19]|uniref:HTH cro/C1-type domain-containing protein n=1 Tax=Alteromonas salexigens TaxID=2982530 RepID=A0ABT2VPG4_9ALTE|nr:hypothetical protein [Alteromonas salexigens]MCU7554783.1 hypothetical protein [Alteromonas salexigens]
MKNKMLKQMEERISQAARLHCKERRLTYSKLQKEIEVRAKSYLPKFEFQRPTILSDLANGKRRLNLEEALVMSKALGFENEFFESWIDNEVPYPLNIHWKKSFRNWVDKIDKEKINQLETNSHSKHKSYGYYFEMDHGALFEIPHGDLTSENPYFKEVDKKRKTQARCTAADFERHMLSGGRTRAICIRKDKNGKLKKQHNMYSINTKGVRSLIKRELRGKKLKEEVIWSKSH